MFIPWYKTVSSGKEMLEAHPWQSGSPIRTAASLFQQDFPGQFLLDAGRARPGTVLLSACYFSLSLSAIHYSFPSACYTHNKHMSFITENIATEDHSPDITKERMHTSNMQNVSNLTTRQGNTQETHNGILLHAHRIGQKLGLAASFLVHRPRRADREPQDD